MTQETLIDDDGQPAEIEDGGNTVFVVVTNYDDDPHPHVEGVFSDRADAEELRKQCALVTDPPHPIAWSVIEWTVDEPSSAYSEKKK